TLRPRALRKPPEDRSQKAREMPTHLRNSAQAASGTATDVTAAPEPATTAQPIAKDVDMAGPPANDPQEHSPPSEIPEVANLRRRRQLAFYGVPAVLVLVVAGWTLLSPGTRDPPTSSAETTTRIIDADRAAPTRSEEQTP